MIKNKLLMILLVISFLPINIVAANDIEMTYEIPETEGNAIFHLDTSLVTFSASSLEKDINYHITTNKGNYYFGNGYKQYSVTIDDDELVDSHGNDVKLAVTFNSNQAQGTLNLNNTVEDNTTYTGRVISTSESTDVAGDYSTSVVVNFNLDDKLMKLASNVYTIHRGVTEDTNYVEVPGIQNGTTIADFKNNFLNEEGTINVYDQNGNLVEDDNAIVTTAMTVQLEDIPSGTSTFSLKARAMNTINDQLGIAIPGDVDGDGLITGNDGYIMHNNMLGWLTGDKNRINYFYFKACDLDKDSSLTVADMTIWQNIYYSANKVEKDNFLLSNLYRRTLNYNATKYFFIEKETKIKDMSINDIFVTLAMADNQYEDELDENDNIIYDENGNYYAYEQVLFDENDNELDIDNMSFSQKRTTYLKNGSKWKVLKRYYNQNDELVSTDSYVYDTLLFILKGDVNCDGRINEEDKTLLTQIVNGEITNITVAQKLAADRNNDGIINTADIDLY